MNRDGVEAIADAVLYEGYLLYPYRASSVKNQQRWNFGVLAPEPSNAQESFDPSSMQAECLLECESTTQVTVKVRFLQSVRRSVGRLVSPQRDVPFGGEVRYDLVDALDIDGKKHVPWEEAREREVILPALLPCGAGKPTSLSFGFASGREYEPLYRTDGCAVGIIVREWEALSGLAEVSWQRCEASLAKATITLSNRSENAFSPEQGRTGLLPRSFLSTHAILRAANGQFVSLLEPPEHWKAWAEQCANHGVWPVLAGSEADRSTVLCSPIILYDYPQIAPESPGNLFDGTEIDEILSLRILTMTEEEKQEMRQSDDRTREILERTENMPPEQFIKLHGALRGLRTVSPEAK